LLAVEISEKTLTEIAYFVDLASPCRCLGVKPRLATS
jgi:hypothetical protein